MVSLKDFADRWINEFSGRIRKIIGVDLAHPRVSVSDRFRDYERELFAELDEELARSLAVEASSLLD